MIAAALLCAAAVLAAQPAPPGGPTLEGPQLFHDGLIGQKACGLPEDHIAECTVERFAVEEPQDGLCPR